MSGYSDGAVVLLASGQTIRMRAVLLFEELALSEIANLRAQAAQKMGGVSTGIGFLGSPGWVLGGMAATALLEGALSNSAKKQGLEILKYAESQSQALIENGHYCDLADISRAHLPYPALWAYDLPIDQPVDMGRISWTERSSFLKRHGLTKADVSDNWVTIRTVKRLVHNGDDFISAKTDAGSMNIRWSQVVAYGFPKLSPAPPSVPTS